ncbi:T9SS type A sorting domain-containing protein, partial [candidate division WOR-3 bacterium]|nr:T9SS type A sorting domain-containing protein [candidate division WOR-3 bacterium]
NGFRYPKTAASVLFLGSFAVGNAADWVADRHFGNPPGGPQNADLNPVDSLVPIIPPGAGDEHFYGKFDDSGHPSPKDLVVTQNSYMDAAAGYDDFVVIEYDIANDGGDAVNGLYAAVFADFDLGTSSSNLAGTDSARRFVWMRQNTSENPTVGVTILDPPQFGNLCCIDHAYLVYPDSCMTDGQKFRIMNGTIQSRTSNRPYDWSVCASVGPFDLPPGASQTFVVAFVGGANVSGVLANVDSAHSWYAGTGVGNRPGKPEAENRLRVEPNPFRRGARVSYHTRTAGQMEMVVYDATGREVERRGFEVRAGNGTYFWQPAELARGIYFVEVLTPDGGSRVKVVRLD